VPVPTLAAFEDELPKANPPEGGVDAPPVVAEEPKGFTPPVTDGAAVVGPDPNVKPAEELVGFAVLEALDAPKLKPAGAGVLNEVVAVEEPAAADPVFVDAPKENPFEASPEVGVTLAVDAGSAFAAPNENPPPVATFNVFALALPESLENGLLTVETGLSLGVSVLVEEEPPKVNPPELPSVGFEASDVEDAPKVNPLEEAPSLGLGASAVVEVEELPNVNPPEEASSLGFEASVVAVVVDAPKVNPLEEASSLGFGASVVVLDEVLPNLRPPGEVSAGLGLVPPKSPAPPVLTVREVPESPPEEDDVVAPKVKPLFSFCFSLSSVALFCPNKELS